MWGNLYRSFSSKSIDTRKVFLMPVTWCSHPVAHSGSTKIGCKPTHPKADRRLDAKLAMFVKESYGISSDDEEYRQDVFFCRTCFEKETAKFAATGIRRTNVSASNFRKKDIEEEQSERLLEVKERSERLLEVKERSERFFLTNRSNAQFSESSHSPTSDEGNDSYLMEYQYQRQQAVNILNDVFEVLKIPRIVDTYVTITSQTTIIEVCFSDEILLQ